MAELKQVYYSGKLSGDFAALSADEVCFIYPDVKLSGIESLTTVANSLLSIYGANVTLMKGSLFTTNQANSGIKTILDDWADVDSSQLTENIYVWYAESNNFETFDSRLQLSITSGVQGGSDAEKQQKYNNASTRLTQRAKLAPTVNLSGGRKIVRMTADAAETLLNDLFGSEDPIEKAEGAQGKVDFVNKMNTVRSSYMSTLMDTEPPSEGEDRVPIVVINMFSARPWQSKYNRTAVPDKTVYTQANNSVPFISANYVEGEGEDDGKKMNFYTDLENVGDKTLFVPLGSNNVLIYVTVERIADVDNKKKFKVSTSDDSITISLIDSDDDDESELDTTDGAEVTVDEESKITVRLTGTTRFLVVDIGSINGEEGNSGGSGNSGGDPYCEPIFGNPIKLPNMCANYRLFESDGMFINARVSEASLDDKQAILEYLKKVGYSQAVIDTAIYDGYFYDRFYIAYNGEEHLINLNTKIDEITNNKEIFKISREELKNPSSLWTDEKGYKMVYKCKHHIHGTVTVSIQYYFNSQIKNGISIIIDRNAKQAMGMLIYNYKPKFMRIPTINTKKYKKLRKRCKKSMTKGKNIYKKQETVVEKNEVWVNKKYKI